MMHKIVKLLKRKQSGQALVLALALLGIGSLMIAPMLSFMGTGLNAGVVAEDKMDELYACDAGVQDAIWQINHLDEPGAIPYTYLDGIDNDTGLPIIPPYEVYDYIDPVIGRPLPHINGMDVGVRITLVDMVDGFGVYQVQTWVPVQSEVSFGVNWGDASTKIDAIITTTWKDYMGIANHVVTSQGDYEIDNKVEVEPLDPYPDNPNGARSDYDGAWPTPEDLILWYSRDIEGVIPYLDEYGPTEGDLEVQQIPSLPPPEDPLIRDLDTLFREGELTIISKAGGADLTLRLNGTVYVTGDTLMGTTNQQFKLDLNGHTIFVVSDSVGSQPALEIGGKTTLTGSGCIIAVGDIKFQPKMEANPLDYILVLSIIGTTTMYPSGDFYGTLAGSVHVDVKSGETPSITWNGPPPDLNFPGSGGGAGMIWGIHTWIYNWNIGDIP